jgi:hypothetical protein
MTRNGRIALDPPSQPVLVLDDDGSLPNLMVDTCWAGGSDYRVHFSPEGGPSRLAWAITRRHGAIANWNL